MVTCRSPARSPLAGGYGEGPKHFFQVDSTQREPQSISAVPPHLVALIEFNVFLRSPFDRVHSLRGGGGGRELCCPEPPSHEMPRSILVPATDFSRDLEERSHEPWGSGSQGHLAGIRPCA